MAGSPRIVAELGRPETPEETADRKAAASYAYRSSKTLRNLIVALGLTLLVVAAIVFAVPRGEMPARGPIDVAAAAEESSETFGRPLVAPEAPSDWIVNSAEVDNVAGASAWLIVYAPPSGYIRVAQGFDTDQAWASRALDGAAVSESLTIGGLTWDNYQLSSAANDRNISYALSTDTESGTVLVYGATDEDTAHVAAEQVAAALAEEGITG